MGTHFANITEEKRSYMATFFVSLTSQQTIEKNLSEYFLVYPFQHYSLTTLLPSIIVIEICIKTIHNSFHAASEAKLSNCGTKHQTRQAHEQKVSILSLNFLPTTKKILNKIIHQI